MPRYTVTPRFLKAFRALRPQQKKRAEKSLRQFDADPRHPSLHLEKLRGSAYCKIRADLNFRIALRDLGEGRYELLDVGSHDYIDRTYG